MANTLGLDDDLDPVLLIKDLEQAFALKFSDEETSNCMTVGDIYTVLIRHMGGGDQLSGRCATAMAFYRLRRACRAMAPEVAITPATPLHIFRHWPAKSLLKQLSLLSGLRLPRPALSKVGHAGAISILFVVPGVFASALLKDLSPLAAFWSFWFLVIAGPIGALLLKIDKGRLPDNCGTVADLARMAAAKNFGMLAREGARWNDESLWLALIETLSERTVLPKSDIRPDTLLLQKALKIR